MKAVRFCLLLLLGLPASLASQPCAQTDFNAALKHVKVVQSQLLAVKLRGDMDEEVPAALQTQIRTFKDALAALADKAVACLPANIDPKVIKARLVKLLDANHPQLLVEYDPKKPPQLDQIYGSDLHVKITRPEKEPQLLLVELSFGIDCGFDSVLLAYEQSGGKWKQVLRWQSPAYNEVSGAFGDFLDYDVLPQGDGKNWLIAVAHGHPWCTSNLSGFDIDLLQPDTGQTLQKTFFHRELYYRRDVDPVMKPEPGGFELRMSGSSSDMNIIIRPVIYRFRQDGNSLVRVQPIAMNGRDFVDEWLESPWEDASRWSAAAGAAPLKQVHEKIKKADNEWNGKESLSRSFGPVRTCTDAKDHYQVELDMGWFDDKGNSRSDGPVFFQIEEGKNSFTILSAAANPDPYCTGIDIMAKQ